MFGLYASIALIFVAGDVVLFLLAWEVMSILCWLLIVCAREKENGHAGSGYLLLAMGEAGTLAGGAWVFFCSRSALVRWISVPSNWRHQVWARACNGRFSCFRFSGLA